MAAISSASLYLRASSTGAEPSTGVTSGRAARRAMRNLLGQALSTPSVPGRRAAASAAVGSSLSWWSTSSSPSWGSRAKRALANSRHVPSARM